MMPYFKTTYVCGVLIDTWWNVNQLDEYKINIAKYGFNRYMVECKFEKPQAFKRIIFVLIDTWWNVNHFAFWNEFFTMRFNRYMVECKFVQLINFRKGENSFNRYMVECK